MSIYNKEWREASGLREVLEFVAGKAIKEDRTYGTTGLVTFTDGSALLLQAEERGFRGSEVTPADPAEVVVYLTDAFQGRYP